MAFLALMRAHYTVTEAQARGTLHWHQLVFLNTSPDRLERSLRSKDLQSRITHLVSTFIETNVPPEFLQEIPQATGTRTALRQVKSGLLGMVFFYQATRTRFCIVTFMPWDDSLRQRLRDPLNAVDAWVSLALGSSSDVNLSRYSRVEHGLFNSTVSLRQSHIDKTLCTSFRMRAIDQWKDYGVHALPISKVGDSN